MRRVLIDVVGDVSKNIQAHHIDGSKRRRFRTTNQRACEAIDFFNRETGALHQLHRLQGREQSDAIGNEVRCVLCTHCAFAQYNLGKLFEARQRLQIGFTRRNDFQQPHVTWRIEEVRSEPMFAKVVAAVFCKRCDGQTGRIRGNECSGLPHTIDHFQQFGLDRGVFNHGFNHPVCFDGSCKVVVKASDFNLPDSLRCEQGWRRTFLERLESGSSLFFRNIE